MKGQNEKMELLGSAPIPKALVALGIPTMSGMLINALYNLADAYFVGRLGTEQMGAVLNIILDPVFIYRFNLGVAGAAVATAISQAVSAILYVCYILRGKSAFHFHIRNCCFSGEILSEILKIGIPTLLFQILIVLSIALTNDAATEYGGSALAAMGPVVKIMSVGSLVIFGFLKGFQPIAGFSYGSGKYDRLREAVRTSVIWSMIFCVLFGLAVAVFSADIMFLFTKSDEEMLRTGQTALRASGLSFIVFGFYTTCSFLFLATGKAKEGCFLGACRRSQALLYGRYPSYTG